MRGMNNRQSTIHRIRMVKKRQQALNKTLPPSNKPDANHCQGARQGSRRPR